MVAFRVFTNPQVCVIFLFHLSQTVLPGVYHGRRCERSGKSETFQFVAQPQTTRTCTIFAHTQVGGGKFDQGCVCVCI